jgi:uncharacterized protein (TIRG00374 family)
LISLLILDINTLFPKTRIQGFNITFFAITLFLLVAYTLLVIYGLFINPKGLKWLMLKFMSLKFLRKWKYKAAETGDQLIAASAELKQKSAAYWSKAFLMTSFTWSGRFLVANCLILIVVSFNEHFILYARQIALMVMLMMSPTPGGSGVAELSFPSLISDLVPYGLKATITALWRTLTYYPYLFLGLVILPRWVSRVFEKPNP